METKVKSIKRSITLPNELYDKIQEDAKKKNITTSTLIKIACSEYIGNEKNKTEKEKKKD